MISIKSLSKSYANHTVLEDVNLRFESGKVYGIVGENGAGKTTLFKCIAQLEDYQGTIAYEGGKLKNKLGFLPTDPVILSKITGLEYLQLMCNARKLKVSPKDLLQKNLFDLPLNRYAENYSTGMKKKLALTAVLLQKNEVFILDEPFNGVDIHSNMVIQEILQELKQQNKTVLFSSHIFSTLKDSCDYLHYLKRGKISKSFTKDNFDELEVEMKDKGMHPKISRLFE